MTQSSLQLSPWNLNTYLDLLFICLCLCVCLCVCVCPEVFNCFKLHTGIFILCATRFVFLLHAGSWACFCSGSLIFSALYTTVHGLAISVCDSCFSTSPALTGRWGHPNPLNSTFYFITSQPSTQQITPKVCLSSRASYLDLFDVFEQEYYKEAVHFPQSSDYKDAHM